MTSPRTEKPRDGIAATEPTRETPIFTPHFDIVETPRELTLVGDLPGVSKNQLDVRFEDDRLILHGKVERRQKIETFLCREYGVGDFHRTFAIGESIDANKITAEMRNGVLTIHLPKAEHVKPRRIEVATV